MVFASIATFLGWVMFVWSLVLACMTHVRSCRYLFGTFIVMIIICFQCLAFVVFRSNFCDANDDCEMGRTGWYVIAASICYFLAALCFCTIMKDYPGASSLSQDEPVAATKGAEGQDDNIEEPQDDKGEEAPEEQAPTADEEPTADAQEEPAVEAEEEPMAHTEEEPADGPNAAGSLSSNQPIGSSTGVGFGGGN